MTIDIQWPEGITTEHFLDQYWQRKPLLIPQAFANFNNPLDPDELAGLACDEDANARFMEQQQDGQWRMCHGPFDDEFFAARIDGRGRRGIGLERLSGVLNIFKYRIPISIYCRAYNN